MTFSNEFETIINFIASINHIITHGYTMTLCHEGHCNAIMMYRPMITQDVNGGFCCLSICTQLKDIHTNQLQLYYIEEVTLRYSPIGHRVTLTSYLLLLHNDELFPYCLDPNSRFCICQIKDTVGEDCCKIYVIQLTINLRDSSCSKLRHIDVSETRLHQIR